MRSLLLHDYHAARGASFTDIRGFEAVTAYAESGTEYHALTRGAGLVDLSFRGRICLLGADREKFLHGQITNDVLKLKTGEGCYAALVNAKAKMESDLYVFKLVEEILLDFEPGLTDKISDRLNRYIIAEDVQIVDVAPHYGHIAVVGPEAMRLLENSSLFGKLPERPLTWASTATDHGEIYAAHTSRFGVLEYDLFVPVGALETLATKLDEAGGEWCGLNALETVRIENGVPRFGLDMTETTLPQEAELQNRAISFSKGCYIGQEIIARIRTYGQVAKALRVLRFPPNTPPPPPGAEISADGKKAGIITSSTFSPKFGAAIALGLVRKEVFAIGTQLEVGQPAIKGEITAIPGGA